ncbi:MAG: nuclear transport factor 2 family protein [Acidobacteriota bacterium]|nr:nuclear transport factor 2 family protein [Acidobacteriota bacterium]
MKTKRREVEAIEAIVKAMYASISGPAGPRDWERTRKLMSPEARLSPAHPGPNGGVVFDTFDVEGYIASRSSYFTEHPFYELEVDHKVEVFGNIAQVWSAYETRHTPGGEPFMRGINSIQLVHDGKSWRILSMVWDTERIGNPFPKELLQAVR